MKKVLYIATTPLTTDGLTAVLIKIANTVSAQCEISFVLGEKSSDTIQEQLRKIGKVHEFPSRKRHVFQYLNALMRLMQQERFDIIHVHGNSATMAIDLFPAFCCRVPMRISHCHNCSRQPWIKQLILGFFLNRFVTEPVACSVAAGRMLYRKKFTVITNGIDCERFSFSEEKRKKMREQLGLGNSFVVGHVGRFSNQKNHKKLLEIFHAILELQPNSKLLLCGEGENLQMCHQLIKTLGMQDYVIFCGTVSNVCDYYQAMDAFVLPSLFEGLPLVGIEAQASGLNCFFSEMISKEVAVLPQTKFVSLELADSEWAKIILSEKSQDRKKAAKLVENSGFHERKCKEEIYTLYSFS